ncbi:SPOR domain-containing protein [Fibrobacter sp. UWB10]|uniref:SPOR domain-containing protein n=1 Tax=Fibrobacter sp. UWB10 TaxID=1896201 RepID=UPI0024035B90|nr:SPOR domain-containing protein [Fibrobacter sp. UWB10]SMP38594.1 Sporulation related domain-containing protein [Fibrobacter sp. UWB10]
MDSKISVLSILLALCCINSFAQTMADAQKAYVAGNWKEAAAAYEAACPKEPDSLRAECYLWNVLALSQMGSAQSFKIAGNRLDSLIKTTNPQRAIYSDLMMTSAQFRLYLGKYDKAAEDLIQAIETSHPHQAIVLQKVCKAVKAKVKSEDLDDRCNLLNNPDSIKAIRTASQAKAAPVAQPVTPEPAPKPAQPAPVVEQPKPAVQATAPAPAPAPAPAAQAPAQEYWTLQLGAFGTKSNADLLVSSLKKQKITCTIIEQPRGERTLYLVQTGKFETKDKAVDFAASKLAPLKIEYQPLLKR